MDEAEVAAVTTEMLESIQQNSGCSFVARLVENYNPDSWFTAVLAGNLSVAISESLEAVQDEEVALLIFPGDIQPNRHCRFSPSFTGIAMEGRQRRRGTACAGYFRSEFAMDAAGRQVCHLCNGVWRL